MIIVCVKSSHIQFHFSIKLPNYQVVPWNTSLSLRGNMFPVIVMLLLLKFGLIITLAWLVPPVKVMEMVAETATPWML